jgi:drug/metabolite transporter (DMT)-like permease
MGLALDSRPPELAPSSAPPRPDWRALMLVLVVIACGLPGLYLVRSAVIDDGGFRVGSVHALDRLPAMATDWRFVAGGLLLAVILLISLELYGNPELSKVVPLYSLSYVVVALVGQLFLDERVTAQRWLGICTIVTGVLLVLRS